MGSRGNWSTFHLRNTVGQWTKLMKIRVGRLSSRVPTLFLCKTGETLRNDKEPCKKILTRHHLVSYNNGHQLVSR